MFTFSEVESSAEYSPEATKESISSLLKNWDASERHILDFSLALRPPMAAMLDRGRGELALHYGVCQRYIALNTMWSTKWSTYLNKMSVDWGRERVLLLVRYGASNNTEEDETERKGDANTYAVSFISYSYCIVICNVCTTPVKKYDYYLKIRFTAL